MSKGCLECGDKIIGREDKKFCSDGCRNAYNNKMNKDSNNLMRNINNKLRKNYRILCELNPEEKTKTTKTKLLSKGFDFEFFTSMLTTKTGNYRKKLEYSKQLIQQLRVEERRFPNTSEIKQLLHSSRFNTLQLSLLRLFINRNKVEESPSLPAHQALIAFAQEKIQLSLGEISTEMKLLENLSCEQYIALSKLLYRSLLTGTWLAGLFNNELRDKFRRPWLDLQQGISELQALWVMQLQLEKLSEPPVKLLKWQASKVEGLLVALDNTKAIAIDAIPYWYE